MPELLRDVAPARKFVSRGEQISHMDRRPIDGGATRDPSPLDRSPYAEFDRDDPVMCFHQQVLTVSQQNCHVIRHTKAACNARDRIQYRLKIEFRAADDRQHLADRRLILQGFRELMGTLRNLARARLLRLEETRVLDGDDGLVGKGSDQLDLFRGKRLRHLSCHEDHSYRSSLPQQRGAERRSVAADLLRITTHIFRIGQHVGKVHYFAFKRRSPDDAAAIQGNRVMCDVVLKLGRKTMACGNTVEFTFAQEDEGICRLAEIRRRFNQGIEHWL